MENLERSADEGAEARGGRPGARGTGTSEPPPVERPALLRGPPPRRRRRKASARVWIGRGVAALVALVVVALGAYAFVPKPVEVDLAAATRGPMRVTVNEDGRARVRERFVVSSPLSGELDRVTLEAGDRVDEGQALATLRPLVPALLDVRQREQAEQRLAAARAAERQAAASVRRAKSALALASAELASQRRLASSGATAKLELERVEAARAAAAEDLAAADLGVQVARSEIEIAAAMLGRRARGGEQAIVVRSPIAGRVLKVARKDAGTIALGAPLLEIGDPEDLELVVDVLTTDAVHVRAGAPATIERWGGDHPLKAHVRRVEPSAYTRLSALGVEEQRVDVLLDLDPIEGPPERRPTLGDGFRVEARILVWQSDDVLSVPDGAVFRSEGAFAVYAASGGRAERRVVEVGRRDGTSVQVLSGLSEGDRVVVHPSDRVAPGVRIAAR